MMMKRKKPICPRCGSVDTMPIVLTQPRPDLPHFKKTESLFGTLQPAMDDFDCVCKECGHMWRIG
jgi:hypothetical protein